MVCRVSIRLLVWGLLSSAALVASPGLPGPVAVQAEPQVSKLAVQAADAALKGRFVDAGALAERSGDQAAIKLVEMLYLRDHWRDAGFDRITAFLAAARKWPYAETLAKRAEQALYHNRDTSSKVLAYFDNRKPQTAEGMLALARAELEHGNRDTAKRWASRAWTNNELDLDLERDVAREFGSLLTVADHKTRMARMIYAQETSAALRAAKFLSKDYQAAAKAAQSLIRGVRGAEKNYSNLSAAMRAELPVQYALARHYRRIDKYAKAGAILAKVPGDAAVILDPEAWWVERRIIARDSLGPANRNQWKTAYQIARGHGLTSGPSFAEAEFLAGWIALRSLKDPETALKHFARLSKGVETRTDRARANYWVGRAHAALGDEANANAAYRRAAETPTVFYGQLAREKLGLGKTPIQIAMGKPSGAAQDRIDNDEVMRAFKLVASTGRDKELNSFLYAISGRFSTKDDMNAAASVVWDEGGAPMTVRLAKLAGQKGIDIDSWGYPISALPAWRQTTKPVERALVYGLSRQESEFDTKAGSPVGAQGLMQIMPATARLIARQHGVGYAESKLKRDPAYNVRLGAAHLGDLIAGYNGSYILTLVAYNAGPRRSREWSAMFGDPRSKEVDPIDWVESIPFQETRNYVQKVLQNTQIYRSRLDPRTMRPMTADLRRGSSATEVAAIGGEPQTVTVAASACTSGPRSIAALITACD
jgi:soluble lytic murein transglycosylase